MKIRIGLIIFQILLSYSFQIHQIQNLMTVAILGMLAIATQGKLADAANSTTTTQSKAVTSLHFHGPTSYVLAVQNFQQESILHFSCFYTFCKSLFSL